MNDEIQRYFEQSPIKKSYGICQQAEKSLIQDKLFDEDLNSFIQSDFNLINQQIKTNHLNKESIMSIKQKHQKQQYKIYSKLDQICEQLGVQRIQFRNKKLKYSPNSIGNMQIIKSNNNNHAYNKILKDINIHLNESNKEDSFVFLNDILDDDDDDIDGYQNNELLQNKSIDNDKQNLDISQTDIKNQLELYNSQIQYQNKIINNSNFQQKSQNDLETQIQYQNSYENEYFRVEKSKFKDQLNQLFDSNEENHQQINYGDNAFDKLLSSYKYQKNRLCSTNNCDQQQQQEQKFKLHSRKKELDIILQDFGKPKIITQRNMNQSFLFGSNLQSKNFDFLDDKIKTLNKQRSEKSSNFNVHKKFIYK